MLMLCFFWYDIDGEITMVRKIFIVTSDMYLYLGLKSADHQITLLYINPDGVFDMDESIVNEVFNMKHAVIFDNRISLRNFNRLMSTIFSTKNCISSMLIDMNGKPCARMYIGEAPKVNSKTLMGIIRQIHSCVSSSTQINFKNKISRYELSERESHIIRAMLNGERVKFLSQSLTISEKNLYNYRGRLHTRLGFSNFNEACLFIFKNEVLLDSLLIKSPCFM